MTGLQAWELIAPIISPLEHAEFNNKEMAEAFLTCYMALKEFSKDDEPVGPDYITFMEDRGFG